MKLEFLLKKTIILDRLENNLNEGPIKKYFVQLVELASDGGSVAEGQGVIALPGTGEK